jgi:superfamily II DNA or RNA helicase
MSDLSELDLGSKRLRPYQCELIEKVRNLVRQGRRRIIVNSPTGSGKTVLGCGLIKLSSQRGKYSMFMAPRRELIKQTAAHLYDCDVRFSVIAAGFEQMSGSECFIVSKDTLASRTLRRKKIEIPKTQLLLHDECHTSAAKEAMLLLTAIEQANPGLVTIGLSATPGRSDGKGLGDFWEEIVTAASYESLISQGFLVSTRVFAPDCPNMKGVRSIDWDSEAAKRVDKPRLVGDVIQHWIKFGESRKTIAFGATVSHAVHLRDEFLKAGIPAACLDQSTPMDERDQMIDDLKSGRIQVLCNCDVLSVGFDEPSVGCVVLAAPTRSLVRYRQRAGRALRPHPDKGGNCIILDHCLDDNTEILTPRGFVGRTAIKDSDMVAALDRTTGKVSWQPILSRIDRNVFDGEVMAEAIGPSINFRVTANHNLVYKKRVGFDDPHWPSEWLLDPISSFFNSAIRFKIPVSGVQDSQGVSLSDPELRFIGWFLTDGCLQRKTDIGISQASHQPQLADLIKCLDECGFDYRKYETDSSLHYQYESAPRKQLSFVVPKGTCPARPRRGWHRLEPFIDKDFSPLLEDVTTEQFEVLLHAIHLGDGCKDRKSGRYRITTGNPVFASRLQSLCVRRGFRCNIHTKPVPANQTRKIKQTKPIYTLNIKKMTDLTLHAPLSRSHCTKLRIAGSLPGERVWCVENPLGTLVIRRQGKVSVVGNSGAVFMHGFPDEDIEWPLEKSRSIDQEYQKKRGEGKTKEPIVCQVCSCTYSGLPACPNCGSRQYRTGRSIAIERGLLKEIKREKKKPVVNSFEQKQKYWNQCLAVMARKGRTCGAAARMYSRAIGSPPWCTKGLQRLPRNQDWKLPVSQVFPNFAPTVQNEPK